MTTEERDALVLANTGLAYETARRLYKAEPVVQRLGTCEDAEQEGLVALMNAAAKYNPNHVSPHTGRPVKFSTYAITAIKRWLRIKGMDLGLIHLPAYLMSAADRPRHRYCAHAERAFATAPLPTDEFGRDALLAPESTPGATADELGRLQWAWRRLTRREKDVLSQRLGLAGEPQTLRAIGRSLGVCKERIRQIERKALEKMRRALCPAERNAA